MGALVVQAPAKVNLYLGVHAERDGRGYHRVDSVMAATDFGDEVTLEEADCLSVTCEPAIAAPEERTTTYKALEALGQAFGHKASFAVHIARHIPERSGLGGSSTDAGAALRGACRIWRIDPKDDRVAAVARRIGADVAFFLDPEVSYLAGAGDALEEQFPTPELHLAIVRAQVRGSNAAEAYAAFDAAPTEPAPLAPYLEALRRKDSRFLAEHATNNLAPAAIALTPELAEVVSWLKGRPGALNALVSGSGACCYALCESADAAASIVQDVKDFRNWWAISSKVVDASQI